MSINTKHDLYPTTVAFIQKYSILDQDKLIIKVSDKFCIPKRQAKQWIELALQPDQSFSLIDTFKKLFGTGRTKIGRGRS